MNLPVNERRPTKPGLRRRGFSLVELLVVLGIIALIAGIGIFATRPFQSRSAVNNGAALLQSWLTVAKQRALFYQRPCGLRLLPGDEIADNNGQAVSSLVTKCVYLQQQDDIYGSGIYTATLADWAAGKLTTATNLPTTLDQTAKAYIEINGSQIYSVQSANGTTVQLRTGIFFPIFLPQNANATYRIYRAPAVLTGGADTTDLASEEVLRMPRGSCINVSANAVFAGANPGTALQPAAPPIDIIFGPDGSVSVPAVNADRIIFWVTGTQKQADGSVDPRQGQPGLVVVVTRTGYVAGYNADVSPNNSPYREVP